MGIVARCANKILMSEEGRLGMSGPEVIETAYGVEEFDSRDRALVWRTNGGKHRYLLGDCDRVVADEIAAFRSAAAEAIAQCRQELIALNLMALEQEHAMLASRLQEYGEQSDSMDIWSRLGVTDPKSVPMLEAEEFMRMAASCIMARGGGGGRGGAGGRARRGGARGARRAK